jgi:hypothetical protein
MAFPSLAQRIKNYVASRQIWAKAGKPIRLQATIEHIYNTYCKECEHYKTTGYACDICGCYINDHNDWNKIAWSTTRCPDEPPKWIEEEGFRPVEEIKVEVIPEAIPPQELPPPPPPEPPKGGCGCGR